MDTDDHLRFLCSMRVFNDTRSFEFDQTKLSYEDLLRDVERLGAGKRKQLVSIHGWCLMKNHFHLLVTESIENGIPQFTKKLVGGYAKYFNEKYKRSGSLFQGKTKKILIESDGHYLHILNYIHLNPLDTLHSAAKWRTGNIDNSAAALKHLAKYRWSSLHDYRKDDGAIGLTEMSLFSGTFPNYKGSIQTYLKDIEVATAGEYLLE